MKIRKATSTDLESILSLNEKLFLFEKAYSDKYNVEWARTNFGRKYFESRIESGIVFIAEEGNTVGYICGQTWSNYYNLKDPNHAELENMFVEEEYRESGVGKLLTKEFEIECRSRGAKSIRVQTILKNERAIEFYKHLGYEPEWLELYKQI